MEVVETLPNFGQIPIQSWRTFKTRQNTQPVKAPDYTTSNVPCQIPYYSTLPRKIASLQMRSNIGNDSSDLLHSKWKVSCKKDFANVLVLRENTSLTTVSNNG